MIGLLAEDHQRAASRAPLSISGFRAMKQKMTRLGSRLAAIVCLVAMAAVLAAPVASAANNSLVARERAGAVPAQRVLPQPRLEVAPRTPGSLNSGSGINAYQQNSSACRSRCGSSCQTMSCSGMNTSTCLSIRQQCRMNCSSRC
jgi:hypothetical protein